MVPVAAQVEPGAVENQRGVAGAVADDQRVIEAGLPVGEGELAEQRAGPRRRVLQAVALRRQGEGQVRFGQGLCQVQADMAAAELMAGQRRGQQQWGGGVGHLPGEEGGEGAVQGAQPAAGYPAVEQGEQRRRVAQGVGDGGIGGG